MGDAQVTLAIQPPHRAPLPVATVHCGVALTPLPRLSPSLLHAEGRRHDTRGWGERGECDVGNRGHFPRSKRQERFCRVGRGLGYSWRGSHRVLCCRKGRVPLRRYVCTMLLGRQVHTASSTGWFRPTQALFSSAPLPKTKQLKILRGGVR